LHLALPAVTSQWLPFFGPSATGHRKPKRHRVHKSRRNTRRPKAFAKIAITARIAKIWISPAVAAIFGCRQKPIKPRIHAKQRELQTPVLMMAAFIEVRWAAEAA